MSMSLPAVLLDTPHWLNWFLTPDGRKIPTNSRTKEPAFKREQGLRERSYSSFAEACCRNPHRLGFDIVEPFVGVDLDHVLEGDHFTERGRELFKALPRTYTERSPSGTGLHLWYLVMEHDKLPNHSLGDA